MKWRALPAVVLGLLLTLPLAWLLGISVKGAVAGSVHSEQLHLVPLLTAEQRHRLLTYERDCRTDADCEPPLRCFFNDRLSKHFCTDSRCMTDLQCPEDFVCRTFDTDNGKDRIRGCALVGVREEGESCRRLPDTREEGCTRGLFCQTRCGRPCRLDEPSSCPTGFFCDDGPDGPSCLPNCDGLSCPEGQRCVSVAKGVSICARIQGLDCVSNPCPKGQDCQVYANLQPADEVWMECLSSCAASEPRCPEGTACYLYQCHKSCDPQAPSACPPGFVCGHQEPSKPWVCLPDSRAP